MARKSTPPPPLPRRKAGEKRRTVVTSTPALDPATNAPYAGWTSWDDYQRKNPRDEAAGDLGLERQQREDRQRAGWKLPRVSLAGRNGTVRAMPPSSGVVDVEFDDEPGVVVTVTAAPLLVQS